MMNFGSFQHAFSSVIPLPFPAKNIFSLLYAPFYFMSCVCVKKRDPLSLDRVACKEYSTITHSLNYYQL